jgi:hypothetical protein
MTRLGSTDDQTYTNTDKLSRMKKPNWNKTLDILLALRLLSIVSEFAILQQVGNE